MGEQMCVRRIENNPSHTLTLLFYFYHEGHEGRKERREKVNK